MDDVRRLEPDDLDALYALRLHALASDPDAFQRTLAEEEERGPAHLARVLADGEGAVFGAFSDGRLTGMVGIYRDAPVKWRHKAQVWGMWVDGAERGRGLGGRLLDMAIAHARTLPGVTQVGLSVEAGRADALRLYRSRGFAAWGTEPRGMRDGDRFMDDVYMWLALERRELPE